METSIVITAYNREKFIISCLESLTKIEYRDFEVILVDDGSTDDTVRNAEKFNQSLPLKILRLATNQGICAARNAGVSACAAEHIIYIDSDSEVYSNWPSALIKALNDSQADVVSGSVKDIPARTQYEEALVGTTIIGKGKLQGRMIVGSNMLFKSEILKNFKFDEALSGSEEDDMQIRLLAYEKKIICIIDCLVIHNHPLPTLNEFLTLTKSRAAAAAQLCYKHNKLARDIFFIQLTLIFVIISLFNKIILFCALTSFSLQVAAIIFNEIQFKNKTLSNTLKAFPILLTYHILKAYYFSAKLLSILLGRDPEIVKSKRQWQQQLYNLHKKHSSSCSFQ